LELLAMQPGNMIANLIGGVFLLFGRPLWPQRHAEMVILLPIDATATGSVRRACVEPCLPARFDLKLAPVRSPDEGGRGTSPRLMPLIERRDGAGGGRHGQF
jgi:hypothetical protein